MASTLIDIRAVAGRLGVHRDTVRKGWRGWVRTKAFPAPVELRPLRWNPDSFDAYVSRRELENRSAALLPIRPTPANDRVAPRRAQDRETTQRDAVLRLMHGRI